HGSLPSRIAPAKLSGCTSNPTTRCSSLLTPIFFGSFLLCCWLLDGRRGRAPDEYLKRRHPGLRGFTPRTSTRVHSVRTHSAFNRGVVAPLHRSSPCRYCASVLVLSLFASPIGRQSKAPASPPVQLNFTHA